MQQQRIGAPYGDIYFVDTPNIDRISNMLYAEQRQREAMRRQKAEAMDNEFAKNVANIRDADVDDVTQKYGEWKLMNQQLMKKKGGITPQDQLELLRKKAEVAKTINGSKVEREREESFAKRLIEKPDDFDDNAHDLIIQKRRMPISSGFKQITKNEDGTETELDLADYNNYRYKGTDFNFQDAETKAMGTAKPILGKETLTEDGFTYTTPVYEFGNTPSQFKESLVGAFGTRKGGESAARLFRQIPPESLQQVDELYKAIPKEKLERMGLDKLDDLNAKNPDNQAEQYAAHMAKLYAINAQPKEGKPVTRRNEAAYLKAQEDKERRMANLRHGLAVALKKTAGAKAEGSEDDSLFIEDYWDGAVEDAINNPDNEVQGVGSLRGGEYRMKVDPTVSKALSRQGLEPEEILVTKDGTVTPKYYAIETQPDKSTKKVFVAELSQPLTRTQALLALGVKATTGNQRYKEAKSAVKNNSETIKGSQVPKGANVTQGTDGSFYYNGKKIVQ